MADTKLNQWVYDNVTITPKVFQLLQGQIVPHAIEWTKFTERGQGDMTDRNNGPSTDEKGQTKKIFTIKLKVFDVESGEKRYCTPEEAKGWDWGDADIVRTISGWQVTTYNQLVFMLYEKWQKGQEEVEMQVVPRFMTLSGG